MTFSKEAWVILSPIEQSIKAKIEKIGTPLKDWDISINYGVKTGCNEAFIINGAKKDELIAKDPKSAEIIRPILRGRDIKRYSYNFADLHLIAAHNGTDKEPRVNINKYPAVKEHLDKYIEQITNREDKGDTPYNLRSCAYMDDFSKQKIAWGNLGLSAQYAFVDEQYFVNAPSPMIVPGDKYILALLNSKVADFYIRNLGVTRDGGFFEYKPMFIEQMPMPNLKEKDKQPFIRQVDKILKKKSQNLDVGAEEQILDNMTYNLFNLSQSEIEFINTPQAS